MLKSMTAYGRGSALTPLGRFVAEIQSVNRKYLEINTALPRELMRFEIDVKKWAAAQIFRGQVNIRIFAHFDKVAPVAVTPNLPLVRQLKAAWDKIAEELGIPENRGFSLSMLAKENDVLVFEEDLKEESQYRGALQSAIEEALKYLMEMKAREGTELQRDIASRLEKMRQWIGRIAEKAPGATSKYRQKLIERLEEVLPGSVENEERILREVCVYAEKIDIAEELTRFESHLKQFNDLMISGTVGSVAKTLEFLLQELNREVNTIGSKSSDVDVSHLVVDIKSELERIREQIQNVE